MTCIMAAGKQKKRLMSSTDSERCRARKKPRFHSSNCLISLKSQISLKWDDYEKKVVPQKEQIGILWSDLAPFIEARQKHYSGLADVTYAPPEIFSWENLRGVLSYEVWATCLTEAERKFLIRFLPRENDAEENIQLLLTGKNHHFGSPSVSWSNYLCYGDIHPDAALKKEKQVKADKKAYRVNLRNYHSNMVETLKNWRKRWLSCDDPENLFRLTFLIAEACLLAGSVRNAYHTRYRGIYYGETLSCETVRKGIFAAGAAFTFFTGILTEFYYISYSKSVDAAGGAPYGGSSIGMGPYN